MHTGIAPAPNAALLKQTSESRRYSIINELGELIQKLALDDPMTAESYVSIDDAIDIDVDCTEPEDVEHVADNEEETVITHREALVAASKLSVYAALHCLEKSQLGYAPVEAFTGLKACNPFQAILNAENASPVNM